MPSLDEALRSKRSGDLDGAVVALEAILAERPSPVALAHLADAQVRRGRYEEAAAALDRAEAAAGSTAFTSRVRADLHYKAGRWADAARCYDDAVALGDDGEWPLVQAARCRLRLGDLDGAQGAAARAVERHPEHPGGWVVLGDIALRQGHPEDAEARYARAHEQDPADEWAYAKLVEARLLRLPEERRDHEIQVLMKTTGRDNKHLLGVLARMRGERGDQQAAAEAWGRRARSGDLFARKQQGFALRKAGRLDEAAALLGACLAADPEDRYVFSSYVSVQTERGATDELRRSLEEALPRAGSRRGAYYGALRKLPPPES